MKVALGIQITQTFAYFSLGFCLCGGGEVLISFKITTHLPRLAYKGIW